MNGAVLTRYGSIPGMGTFGQLKTNGWSCVTVELDIPIIPLGTYECTLYESPKHGDVYMLKDVPGHTFVEIHVANVMQDLEGCIGLGKYFTSMSTRKTMGRIMWAISDSAKTVREFMHVMDGKDFLLSVERAL